MVGLVVLVAGSNCIVVVEKRDSPARGIAGVHGHGVDIAELGRGDVWGRRE